MGFQGCSIWKPGINLVVLESVHLFRDFSHWHKAKQNQLVQGIPHFQKVTRTRTPKTIANCVEFIHIGEQNINSLLHVSAES